MAAEKDKKTKTGGRKKNTSARRSSSPRKKAKASERPTWIYAIVAVLFSCIFIAGAYYIFFRPYFYRFRPCYGTRHYGICMPSGYSVYGLDISRHQGNINWSVLKEGSPENAPIEFIYIKATEGSDFSDVQFKENFAQAKQHGFIRGAYHYFSRHSNGLAQAEMFIKSVKLEKGDLPPMVDVEERPKNRKQFLQELKIFIAKIEEHYGVKPIIYSYKKYKEKYLTDSFFDKYPLWIAHYYVTKLDEDIEWLMWQCSDIGSVPGIKGNVDVNIFNGNKEQLKSILIK
ncbi:MAG: glycoside hydrolase family 25 protein [Bacteroidaceae bacterium]|nr:glycoside hydrolase family 25 protein [Bacteroidaceae bacterium]